MVYRREIDGLRALAVIPVILFHAGFAFFEGGFVGVDVFFVISGYLIASILIAEFENDNFSIVRFYERRARRILPALIFVIVLCFPFAWSLMLPEQMKDFSQSIVAIVFFASNILFWQESDYFAPAAEEKPLLHTWSLAVEEQFYVFFPLFLMVAWRFGRNRVFWTIVIFCAVSLALSEWGWRKSPEANFYLAPSRAWELLAGVMSAFIVRNRNVQSNNALSLTGLFAIVFAILWYDKSTPFPSMYSVIPVLGVVLLLLYSGQEAITTKLLGTRVLVGIGLISYSAYLWHQPLFAFIRLEFLGHPPLWVMGVASIASLALACLSWKYVENPWRRKSFATRRQVFGASFVAMAILLLVGSAGHISDGFKFRFKEPQFVTAGEFELPMRWQGYCFYSFNDRSLDVGEEGTKCSIGTLNPEDTSVLLFGDSYAAHWEPYFKLMAADYRFQIDSVTTNWCFPSLLGVYTAPEAHISREQCDLNRRFLALNHKEYDVLVFSAAWHQVEKAGYQKHVLESLSTLADNSPDTKIIVIDVPPQFVRRSVEMAIYDKDQPLLLDSERNSLADTFWNSLDYHFQNRPNFFLLGRNSFEWGGNGDFKNSEGYPYSLEGGHMSVYGSKILYFDSRENGIPDRIAKFIGE